jgi:outer membrane biosynthesis protein TonB
MAMDRAERIGLGTAVGGHALLLGAFALAGLLTADRIVKPQPISVTLDGPVADVSTARDPVQEEPAPAPDTAEPEPAEAEPAPAMKIEKPTPKPLPKAVEKPKPSPQAKPTPKPLLKQAATPPKPKSAAQPTPKQATPKQANPRPFSKNFEDAVRGTGSNPQPTQGTAQQAGTVARKAGPEVRREVNAALGPQIRDKIERCAPTGLDIRQIETFVTLNLDATGRLLDVRVDKQTGINDNNRPQAEPLKRCIIQAVRAASPFRGLDPEYHDVWKTHAMRLRATG